MNWFEDGDFAAGAFARGLVLSAVALVVLFGLTFALARRLGKHSVVDVAWGLGFVVVAVVTLWASDNSGHLGRRWVLTAMVVLWGSRLAWHIARRNAGHGEDPRYEALLGKVAPEKRTAYALRTVYGLQALLVLFISLPVQVASFWSSSRPAPGATDVFLENGPGLLLWFGVGVWAVGLFFEAVGDHQLKTFKADPANRGKVMDRGLWRYTRHPNYFGDACVWWGIWLVAAETGIGVFTILSPIVMTLFLTKGSGAALTERRMAGRPGFEEYVARTSGFVPLPPRRR